jgi:hypothetical protein
MSYFRVESHGDTVYVKCDDERDVPDVLRKWMGPIPAGEYEVTQVAKLPAGEEALE